MAFVGGQKNDVLFHSLCLPTCRNNNNNVCTSHSLYVQRIYISAMITRDVILSAVSRGVSFRSDICVSISAPKRRLKRKNEAHFRYRRKSARCAYWRVVSSESDTKIHGKCADDEIGRYELFSLLQKCVYTSFLHFIIARLFPCSPLWTERNLSCIKNELFS